jgi:hypothetical protein
MLRVVIGTNIKRLFVSKDEDREAQLMSSWTWPARAMIAATQARFYRAQSRHQCFLFSRLSIRDELRRSNLEDSKKCNIVVCFFTSSAVGRVCLRESATRKLVIAAPIHVGVTKVRSMGLAAAVCVGWPFVVLLVVVLLTRCFPCFCCAVEVV